VGKRHDGFTCKRLTGTKNTIKADGTLTVPTGQPGFHSAILIEIAVEPAASWTSPDLAGKANGARRA